MITLTLQEPPPVPLEAEMLTPDTIAPLTIDEVRSLPIYLGKRQRRVGDFFAVEGESGDELEIRGDAGRVKWIGRGMTRGRIRIDGHAGMHLGSAMKGGAIEVSGDAGDWLGAEMSGGFIHVHCSPAYFETGDVLDRVLHFSRELGADDRKTLSEALLRNRPR